MSSLTSPAGTAADAAGAAADVAAAATVSLDGTGTIARDSGSSTRRQPAPATDASAARSNKDFCRERRLAFMGSVYQRTPALAIGQRPSRRIGIAAFGGRRGLAEE